MPNLYQSYKKNSPEIQETVDEKQFCILYTHYKRYIPETDSSYFLNHNG